MLRLALCLSCLAGPAFAGLTICNETEERAVVAIGYQDRDSGDWVSEGWWGLEAEACKQVRSGDRPNANHYWRAESGDRVWRTDGHLFCTDIKAFTISGDTDCEARGFRREAFALHRSGSGADATIRLGPADLPPADMIFGEPFAKGRVDLADRCPGSGTDRVILVDYRPSETGLVCWEVLGLSDSDLHLRHAAQKTEYIYTKAR